MKADIVLMMDKKAMLRRNAEAFLNGSTIPMPPSI